MSDAQQQSLDRDEDIVDLEEFAKDGQRPPSGKPFRIRIDRDHFVVEEPCKTGRELLQLAGKCPPEQWMISQKLRGGQVEEIGLDEKADFTTPGVERFMTLPLDQTEG